MRRLVVTMVGIGLFLAGIAMLVAPGPGLIVIALSLLVLGTEYEWAQRRYDDVKLRAEALAERAVARKSSLALSTAGGLGMIGAGVALIVVERLPGAGLVTGLTLSLGGAIVLATLGWALRHARAVSRSRTG